jgi:hypothetical protein
VGLLVTAAQAAFENAGITETSGVAVAGYWHQKQKRLRREPAATPVTTRARR